MKATPNYNFYKTESQKRFVKQLLKFLEYSEENKINMHFIESLINKINIKYDIFTSVRLLNFTENKMKYINLDLIQSDDRESFANARIKIDLNGFNLNNCSKIIHLNNNHITDISGIIVGNFSGTLNLAYNKITSLSGLHITDKFQGVIYLRNNAIKLDNGEIDTQIVITRDNYKEYI